MSFPRIDFSQQVVLDTSGGSAVNKTIPEDPGPAGSSPGMYSGRSFWAMFVGVVAHNVTMTPPVASTTVVPPGGNTPSGSPTSATVAMGLIPITNSPIFVMIPAGTIVSAITQHGAPTTDAKVSFFRCYP